MKIVFFLKIPLIGSLVKSFTKFIAQYDTLSEQIEKIVDELHKSRMMLLKTSHFLIRSMQKKFRILQRINTIHSHDEMKLAELTKN